ELTGKSLALVLRNSIGLHVAIDELAYPARRHRERICPGDLVEQLLTYARFGVPAAVLLQILSHRGLERVQRLEVTNLACEAVVESRQLLALHVLQRHPDGLAL